MTIEQQLKELIIMKYGSIVEFSKVIDMPNTTLSSIINRGVHTASVANMIKICRALGITVDGVCDDKIITVDGKQIEVQNIDDFRRMSRLIAYNNIFVEDENDKLQPEDVHTINDAMDVAVELIKRRHQREKDIALRKEQLKRGDSV